MPNIGAPELVLILAIALLVFGAGRLTELGSAVGKAVREFRQASADEAKPASHTRPQQP